MRGCGGGIWWSGVFFILIFVGINLVGEMRKDIDVDFLRSFSFFLLLLIVDIVIAVSWKVYVDLFC